MRRILFSFVLLFCSLCAVADDKVYVYGEPGDYYFGMFNRVADNGRWAVGTDDGYQTGSYMIDTAKPEQLITVKGGELYDVTNDGTAVGAWYDNQGSATEPIYYAHAGIYRNGGWSRLPEPASCNGRSYARCVSVDGNIIAGMVFCPSKDSDMGGKYYPCLWTLNSDGTYAVTVYDSLKLPGNMGFYVNDMTADGRTLVGTLCTDAGGTVPAIVTDGKLLCWNKMEWKQHAFNIEGKTVYYEAGFVDGVLEGSDEAGWFSGGFNYISGNFVYGHRTVATNVDTEKATGTLTHYRTIYNLTTGEFIDEPGNCVYSCGYDAQRTFLVSNITGYYKENGSMNKVAAAFGIDSPVDIASVYGCDADGRVFACSMVWLNEAIGEYCESPVLMILDKSLKDCGMTQPDQPTQTSQPKSFTLSPSNSEDVAKVADVVTITFPTLASVRIASNKINLGDGATHYTLTLGDRPNELKFNVQPALVESGEYVFTVPEGSLVDASTNQWLPQLSFAYNVDASLANGGGWTVSPSLDDPVPQLEGTYTITLTNYKRIEWESTVRPCRVFIYKDGSDTSTRPLAYYDATVKSNTITFTAKPGVYETGNYIILLSEFVNAADKSEIPDIKIPFTLTGGTPPVDPGDQKPALDQTYVLAPDNHAPLPELSGRIVVTFPGIESFADIGGFPTIITPSGEKIGVFEDGTVLRVKSFPQLDGADYISNAGYIDLDAVGLRFTEPGEYTISIPKNVFHVDGDYDKDYVDPFQFTYTVGYPAPVLFDEDFDGSYGENFPQCYDGDGLEPASAISSWFLSAEHGFYMPWWVLRESSADPDRFMGSHSYYSTPGKSDDWMVSRPITIPAPGYTLSFDAQSVVLRSGNRLSDLELYISEEPVTNSRRPAKPATVFKQVPCGKNKEVTTGEWTNYQLSMDNWVGKTVYLCFVNRNTDRDVLCINNVRVYRPESVEVAFDDMPAVTADDEVTASVTVLAAEGDLKNYKVEFLCRGIEYEAAEAAEPIFEGTSRTFTTTIPLQPCVPTTIVFRFTPAGSEPIERSAAITRLAFRPRHRVLIEETTGLWCGNCPIGIYNIESLKDDASIADDVLPVSVHITGGTTDLMATDATNTYADFLGLGGVAPMTRIDRGPNAVGFSTMYDTKYDPDNASSFAHLVHARRNQLTLFDIDVEAQPVVNGTDTVAFACTARVTPALDLDPQRYRVGFILTENNVGLDGKTYWAQHNYFSGYPFESKLGGWTELPDVVQNLRYHYVARALPNAAGIEGSFEQLTASQPCTVESTLLIPSTYRSDSRGNMASMAVRPYMCEVTAYIVDAADLSIQNSARTPITPQALNLYTVSDYLADGIQTINSQHSTLPRQPLTSGKNTPHSATSSPRDLQGRPVPPTYKGLVIVNGQKQVW